MMGPPSGRRRRRRVSLVAVLVVWSSSGLVVDRAAPGSRGPRRRAAVVEEEEPRLRAAEDNSVPESVSGAMHAVAAATVALLTRDESAAAAFGAGSAEGKRKRLGAIFEAYDVDKNGLLEPEEARRLFVALASSLVEEVADGAASRPAAKARAKAASAQTIDDVADSFMAIATRAWEMNKNHEGSGERRISLVDLADVFETVHRSTNTSSAAPNDDVVVVGRRHEGKNAFVDSLGVGHLAGSLQLLPPRTIASTAASTAAEAWHAAVPGDDNSLRRWVSPTFSADRLSVVGIGRSAAASAYFLPELGIVFDAGLKPKSLEPKCVLLTHGHRDHTQALPALSRDASLRPVPVYAPRAVEPLVRAFLQAEAVLNYGRAQSEAETASALGAFDIRPVDGGSVFTLPLDCYQSSPHPLGVEVFDAPHKAGVPACSYGLFRTRKRLKAQFAQEKHRIADLVKEGVDVTEFSREGLLFYTGDTTIGLLRDRHAHILSMYPYIIHECTFCGDPSEALDDSASSKGHTHYAQIHPYICDYPETTFILVHWSIRYSKTELEDFFDENYGGVPANVVLWL